MPTSAKGLGKALSELLSEIKPIYALTEKFDHKVAREMISRIETFVTKVVPVPGSSESEQLYNVCWGDEMIHSVFQQLLDIAQLYIRALLFIQGGCFQNSLVMLTLLAVGDAALRTPGNTLAPVLEPYVCMEAPPLGTMAQGVTFLRPEFLELCHQLDGFFNKAHGRSYFPNPTGELGTDSEKHWYEYNDVEHPQLLSILKQLGSLVSSCLLFFLKDSLSSSPTYLLIHLPGLQDRKPLEKISSCNP